MNVRQATSDDLPPMVEVMFAEPGVEQRAFMPTLDGARRFTLELWRRAPIGEFTVAADDGKVVGFSWCSERVVSARAGMRAAVAGWSLTGPVRLVLRGWPRQLVNLAMPPGPKLMELQTHPSVRGQGIGSALLADVIARVGAQDLSLTTRTDNPAQRLYERHGFVVTKVRTHRAYERRTGAAGRILMIRGGRGSQ